MPVPIRSPFRSRLVQAPSVAGALGILSGMFAPVEANTALYTVTDLGSLSCCRIGSESDRWRSSPRDLEVDAKITAPRGPNLLPGIERGRRAAGCLRRGAHEFRPPIGGALLLRSSEP